MKIVVTILDDNNHSRILPDILIKRKGIIKAAIARMETCNVYFIR